MKTLKGLSAALSLTMLLTSLTGMPTAFAADSTGTAAVQTAAAQKTTYDEIYALDTSVRALRDLFEKNGRYEKDGYKLLIQEYISGLLEQNKFPAVLLNAEKFALSAGEAEALKAENPDAEICTDQGFTWSVDKVTEALAIPSDLFQVKLKAVQNQEGGKTETFCECAAIPRSAEKTEEYVRQLTAVLNCIQQQDGFAGFAYEDLLGKFYGTDAEFGDHYNVPDLHGLDVIRHMTDDEIRKMFAAREMTEDKGYRVWTKEDVSAALEDGKIPASILYPDKYAVPQAEVDTLMAQYGSDPDIILMIEDGVMWDWGVLFSLSDASNYTMCWKTYKTEPDAYKPGYDRFCKVAIIPFCAKDYGTYTAYLTDALNYIQLDSGFAGFYFEDLDGTFYGNNKLLDDGYMIPDWSPFDVISFMSKEEIEQAFQQAGLSEERGNKLWTAENVLALLDKGEFPSVILNPSGFSVDEDLKAYMLEKDPDAVFTEDQGVCWNHDLLYHFLDMPRDKYTLKVKTIIEQPDMPYAVPDIYSKWVMIPKDAENMDAYAKAVADALNIVQIRVSCRAFDTEKMDKDFCGTDTVPENQYLLPVVKTEIEKLPVTRLAGDVNLDGSADVADAVLIARYAAEDPEAKLTDAGRINADLDGDGNVTTDDLTALLRKIAHMI